VTIAFDAFASSTANVGNLTWTHTPVGVPRGILVLINQDGNTATDTVTGVTYGGVAMAEVALSPLLHDAGAEDGAVYGYFLGTGIPIGAQSVVMSSPLTTKRCGSYSYTAANDTEVENTAVLNSAGVANPQVVLTTTRETAVAATIISGQQAPTSLAPLTGYTMVLEQDYGNQSGEWIRGTANFAAGSPTPGWTATIEEAGVIAVAVAEIAAAAADMLDPMGVSGFFGA
jgi:hypothetical protein